MRDLDIMRVLVDWPNRRDFSKRELGFVSQVAGILAKNKGITPAQHQYLQSIYDRLIAFRYGLEPMGTDREFAARRAIRRARESGQPPRIPRRGK